MSIMLVYMLLTPSPLFSAMQQLAPLNGAAMNAQASNYMTTDDVDEQFL